MIVAGLAKSTLGKAATLAIVGGVYQGTQSFLESSVGKSNWNTAIGGCAAGFALGVRSMLLVEAPFLTYFFQLAAPAQHWLVV